MDYDLKLTQHEINVIAQGLGELPLKISVALFSKIQLAVKEQDEAKAVPLDSLNLSECQK